MAAFISSRKCVRLKIFLIILTICVSLNKALLDTEGLGKENNDKASYRLSEFGSEERYHETYDNFGAVADDMSSQSLTVKQFYLHHALLQDKERTNFDTKIISGALDKDKLKEQLIESSPLDILSSTLKDGTAFQNDFDNDGVLQQLSFYSYIDRNLHDGSFVEVGTGATVIAVADVHKDKTTVALVTTNSTLSQVIDYTKHNGVHNIYIGHVQSGRVQDVADSLYADYQVLFGTVFLSNLTSMTGNLLPHEFEKVVAQFISSSQVTYVSNIRTQDQKQRLFFVNSWSSLLHLVRRSCDVGKLKCLTEIVTGLATWSSRGLVKVTVQQGCHPLPSKTCLKLVQSPQCVLQHSNGSSSAMVISSDRSKVTTTTTANPNTISLHSLVPFGLVEFTRRKIFLKLLRLVYSKKLNSRNIVCQGRSLAVSLTVSGVMDGDSVSSRLTVHEAVQRIVGQDANEPDIYVRKQEPVSNHFQHAKTKPRVHSLPSTTQVYVRHNKAASQVDGVAESWIRVNEDMPVKSGKNQWEQHWDRETAHTTQLPNHKLMDKTWDREIKDGDPRREQTDGDVQLTKDEQALKLAMGSLNDQPLGNEKKAKEADGGNLKWTKNLGEDDGRGRGQQRENDGRFVGKNLNKNGRNMGHKVRQEADGKLTADNRDVSMITSRPVSRKILPEKTLLLQSKSRQKHVQVQKEYGNLMPDGVGKSQTPVPKVHVGKIVGSNFKPTSNVNDENEIDDQKERNIGNEKKVAYKKTVKAVNGDEQVLHRKQTKKMSKNRRKQFRTKTAAPVGLVGNSFHEFGGLDGKVNGHQPGHQNIVADNNMAVNNMADNMADNNMVVNNMADNKADNNMAVNNMADNNVATNNMADNKAVNNMAVNNVADNNVADNNMADNNVADNNVADNKMADNNMATNNMAENNVPANNMAGDNMAGARIADINTANNVMVGNDMADKDVFDRKVPIKGQVNMNKISRRKSMDKNVIGPPGQDGEGKDIKRPFSFPNHAVDTGDKVNAGEERHGVVGDVDGINKPGDAILNGEDHDFGLIQKSDDEGFRRRLLMFHGDEQNTRRPVYHKTTTPDLDVVNDEDEDEENEDGDDENEDLDIGPVVITTMMSDAKSIYDETWKLLKDDLSAILEGLPSFSLLTYGGEDQSLLGTKVAHTFPSSNVLSVMPDTDNAALDSERQLVDTFMMENQLIVPRTMTAGLMERLSSMPELLAVQILGESVFADVITLGPNFHYYLGLWLTMARTTYLEIPSPHQLAFATVLLSNRAQHDYLKGLVNGALQSVGAEAKAITLLTNEENGVTSVRFLKVTMNSIIRKVLIDCESTSATLTLDADATVSTSVDGGVPLPLLRAQTGVGLEFLTEIGVKGRDRSNLFSQYFSLGIHQDMCPTHIVWFNASLIHHKVAASDKPFLANVQTRYQTERLLLAESIDRELIKEPFSFLDYNSDEASLITKLASAHRNSTFIVLQQNVDRAKSLYKSLKSSNINNTLVNAQSVTDAFTRKLLESPDFLRYQLVDLSLFLSLVKSNKAKSTIGPIIATGATTFFQVPSSKAFSLAVYTFYPDIRKQFRSDKKKELFKAAHHPFKLFSRSETSFIKQNARADVAINVSSEIIPSAPSSGDTESSWSLVRVDVRNLTTVVNHHFDYELDGHSRKYTMHCLSTNKTSVNVYLIRKTDGFKIPYGRIQAVSLIALLRMGLLDEIKTQLYDNFLKLPLYEDMAPWNIVFVAGQLRYIDYDTKDMTFNKMAKAAFQVMAMLMNYQRTVDDFGHCNTDAKVLYGFSILGHCVSSNFDGPCQNTKFPVPCGDYTCKPTYIDCLQSLQLLEQKKADYHRQALESFKKSGTLFEGKNHTSDSGLWAFDVDGLDGESDSHEKKMKIGVGDLGVGRTS